MNGAGIGNHHDAEAGGVGGLVSGRGVFEGDGMVGVDSQGSTSRVVDIGGWLGVGDVVATNGGFKIPFQPEALQVGVDVVVEGIGRDGGGHPEGSGVLK